MALLKANSHQLHSLPTLSASLSLSLRHTSHYCVDALLQDIKSCELSTYRLYLGPMGLDLSLSLANKSSNLYSLFVVRFGSDRIGSIQGFFLFCFTRVENISVGGIIWLQFETGFFRGQKKKQPKHWIPLKEDANLCLGIAINFKWKKIRIYKQTSLKLTKEEVTWLRIWVGRYSRFYLSVLSLSRGKLLFYKKKEMAISVYLGTCLWEDF